MMRPTLIIAALLAVAPVPALAQAPAVDLERFDGRWFEIVRRPNRAQRECSRSQIDFTSSGERYAVQMVCVRLANGQRDVTRATARVTDTDTNARFRMSLSGIAGLVSQTYVVWEHAPDYSWAIMGLPDKRYWWIWHRDQNASETVRTRLLARARALGFDTSRVAHTGR